MFIVTSLAGEVLLLKIFPGTVTISPLAKPVPTKLSVTVYSVLPLLMSNVAPEPEPVDV